MGVRARRTLSALGAGALMAAIGGCPPPAENVGPYAGRWDMTLRTPEREYASWLEVVEKDGGPRVRLVSRWGHARWLDEAAIVDGKLRFVSPAGEEGLERDLVFVAHLQNGHLAGTAGDWTFDAVRAPALDSTSKPAWGEAQTLFDGTGLSGWHKRGPSAGDWRVLDGVLVAPERGGSDLVSDARFTDFKLHAEFRVTEGANSGIYLRGRYEVQIENDPAPEGPTMRTAGVYGYLAPDPPAPRMPGVWHAYDIILIGRTVTIALDGKTVIRGAEIPGLTGGALSADEGTPGPIMLQGSEGGRIEYRNIVVTPADPSSSGSNAGTTLSAVQLDRTEPSHQ